MDNLREMIDSMAMCGKEFVTLFQIKSNCFDCTDIEAAVMYALDAGLTISYNGALYYRLQDVAKFIQ